MRVMFPVAVALGLLLGLVGFGIQFAAKGLKNARYENRPTTNAQPSEKTPEFDEVWDMVQRRHSEELRQLFENLDRNRKAP